MLQYEQFRATKEENELSLQFGFIQSAQAILQSGAVMRDHTSHLKLTHLGWILR